MIKIIQSLEQIPVAEWNQLQTDNNPFLNYYFLTGLEKYCFLEDQGWTPSHIAKYDNNELTGLFLLYIKTDSYGEFVFDWAWAEAYEQSGRRYYPKLVSAIPFSPVTGSRILLGKNIKNKINVSNELINSAIRLCESNNLSSLHCLFNLEDEFDDLESKNIMTRTGCQYHWFNDDYCNFEDFLQNLNSKRRKQIKKERNAIIKQGIEIEILHGNEINAEQWKIFYSFYTSTFYRKWGNPRLTLEFFQSLSRNMPESTLLCLARDKHEYIAGAYAMKNENTVYGRHWGCNRRVQYLHFELCYYKIIEYCIAHGLKKLDAGAQGEHKIYRGFIPVKTWSTHWIREPWFQDAIKDFLQRETVYINNYINELYDHVPFKKEIN